MPYHLSKNKLCVLDADGKQVKCHPTPRKAKAHLIALNMNVTKPELAQKIPSKATEAGARNSRSDLTMLQQIHDHAVGLGAMCPGAVESVLAKAMRKGKARRKAEVILKWLNR